MSSMSTTFANLVQTPRRRLSKPQWSLLWSRRSLLFAIHAILFLLIYAVAVLLRFDGELPKNEFLGVVEMVALLVLIKLFLFGRAGLITLNWKYSGMSDLKDIVRASLYTTTCFAVLALYVFKPAGYPRSVIVLDFILTVMVLGGCRFVSRLVAEHAAARSCNQRTIIIGSGRDSCALVRELRMDSRAHLRPIGIVDDDPSTQGTRIEGLRVLGTYRDLRQLLDKHKVNCVLISGSDVSGKELQEITKSCRNSKVEFKILPTLSERLAQQPISHGIRNVRIEDLLGRAPVCLNTEQIKTKFEDRIALVTGGAGSIGSELARQLAVFNVRKLILLDRSENELFKTAMEMSTSFPTLDFVPVVADVLDVSTLKAVFGKYRPEIVFHAAAYKHVPMMESNCFAAVVNNVFGTYNVALVARDFECSDFVLISTDKAVRPANIMGASKRAAELTISSLDDSSTSFIAVRFGNVLGSNGSVLPIFRRQLESGLPLTVTHPEARRYFMSIPEAAQLVLEAASSSHSGQILELDMGEQVRILDLAEALLRFAGINPEGRIVFTGLRPGEKLTEELRLDSEEQLPTSHEKIRALQLQQLSFPEVLGWLDDLSAQVSSRNVNGLVGALRRFIPEYSPSPEVLQQCTTDRHDFSIHFHKTFRVAA
jgi:FlaA1/EpsC-like NDP-sugar epimerase